MSWSFSQTGPITAVKDAFQQTLQQPLPDPEKSARRKVFEILDKLNDGDGGFSEDYHCAFEASGSQVTVDGVVTQSTVHVSITSVPAA